MVINTSSFRDFHAIREREHLFNPKQGGRRDLRHSFLILAGQAKNAVDPNEAKDERLKCAILQKKTHATESGLRDTTIVTSKTRTANPRTPF